MILNINFGAAIHLDKDLQSVSSLKKGKYKKSRYMSISHHIKLAFTTAPPAEIIMVAYFTSMITPMLSK